ncbi:DNAJC28 [Mytilus edulis]|uniref:DNAJC28 n=1 Tax=Mytilus edulis TaxID=6550 RepID=A0A8S3UJA1_MYTED|nr:DNAJC28 [Mytilus edulis]
MATCRRHYDVLTVPQQIIIRPQKSSINVWLNAGLPRNKLVVGIPAYGNTYETSPGTHMVGATALGLGKEGQWSLQKGKLAYYERSISCGHKFTSNKLINVPRVNGRRSHVILSYFSMSGSGQKEANLRGKNKLYQNFSSVLCLKRKVFVWGTTLLSTSSINCQIGYKLKNNVKDCYSLFNLSPDCTEEELREAYLRLAKQYHPDSGTSTACPHKFSQIQDAYKAIRV